MSLSINPRFWYRFLNTNFRQNVCITICYSYSSWASTACISALDFLSFYFMHINCISISYNWYTRFFIMRIKMVNLITLIPYKVSMSFHTKKDIAISFSFRIGSLCANFLVCPHHCFIITSVFQPSSTSVLYFFHSI